MLLSLQTYCASVLTASSILADSLHTNLSLGMLCVYKQLLVIDLSYVYYHVKSGKHTKRHGVLAHVNMFC